MKISLNEFEFQVERVLLERGLRYYLEGHVGSMIELDNGKYRVFLKDSDRYVVNLTIRNGIVENFSCECQNNRGPICQHVVATLFNMRKDFQDFIFAPDTSNTIDEIESLPKKSSIVDEVDGILISLKENEMKDFIRQTCSNDREFRFRFLSKFANTNAPASSAKASYIMQIQNLIIVYSGRHGFIGYREAKEFGAAISEILDNARTNIDNGNTKQALAIIFAVLEEVTPVMNSADDSNGYIGGCIEEAVELISELIETEIDESLRSEILNLLLETFENGKLHGWDWHFDLISFAIQLLRNPQEKQRIQTIITSIKPTGESYDWDYRKAQELMHELLLRTENEEEVTQYLKENVSNPDFRERLIKQAIKTNDYKYALELANDGIAKDESNDYIGLANKWREYQLDIYQKLGDDENIIRLAHYFVMKGSSAPESLKDYYNLLKKTISTDLWGEYLEKMVAELLKKENWTTYDKLGSLYIWEEYWDRYLILLQQNVTLSRIEAAEKYLTFLYPDQLISLYDLEIRSYIEKNVGRSYYIEACRYIKRMRNLGDKKTVDKLIEEMKNQYKNRRALLEELTKL